MARRKMIRVRGRNQVTLPGEITGRLGLREDDYLAVEVTETGQIRLTPARLVRAGTAEAVALRREAEEDVRRGRYETYSSAQELTQTLLRRMRKRHASTLKDKLAAVEEEVIRNALNEAEGDRRQAAELLGLSHRDLRQKVKKYKIEALASE